MFASSDGAPRGPQRLAFWLLILFMIALWLAGGASRADALGQVFTRAAAWTVLVVTTLTLPRPNWKQVRPVAILLGLATALVALQLVPLPPALWGALPGRTMLATAPTGSGIGSAWLPLTISRAATLNALSSLVVPVAVLTLVASIPISTLHRLAGVMLALVGAAALLGLFQFTGATFDHPLINDQPGEIGGSFANRNHLALFVAIGILLAPGYLLVGDRPRRWQAAAVAGLALLFVMILLAIGSRAGLVLGAVAIVVGLAMVRSEVAAVMRRLPGRVRLLVVGASALAVGIVAASVYLGRAQAIGRLQEEGIAEGLRGAIRPTVIDMIGTYFPLGSGFGTFDPAYRIAEPTDLLGPKYVNLAHNDLLQVPLDGGLAGALLLFSAIGWWALASVRAWGTQGTLTARLGSAILLLVMIGSALDYPARTPMIMAVVVLAAVWLIPAPRHGATAPIHTR